MAAPATVASIYLPTSTAVGEAVNVSFSRGRTSPVFDEIDPGRGSLMANNENRKFDPLYSSSPLFGNIVPGRRCSISSTPQGGSAVSIFDAFVTDWNFDYDIQGRSVAVAQLEDGLGRLGRASFDEWTTTRGQQPGARLASVIARPEVGYAGAVSFDTGAFYLQDDFVSWGSNVLNYMQLVARTDQGLLFVDRSGTLRFKDRLSFIGVTPAVTLGTGGIGFAGIATSYGTELLYNRVSNQRFGGEPQSVQDNTSIAAYGGTFTLSRSDLLMEDDISALDLATRELAMYKDPLYRFESVDINVHGLSAADQALVLALDIGSVVSVAFTPNQVGSAITRTCIVEGVRHSLAPSIHTMGLTLNDSSIAQTGNFYTTEDNTYGTIDAAGVFDYPLAF